MTASKRNELIAALAVCAIGAGALVIALGYPMGTVVRMGAGFFPVSLSILLIVLGLVLALQSRSQDSQSPDLRWRPFTLILGGILAWALLVNRLGFLPSTIILVPLCAMVEPASTVRSAALLAAGLSVVGWLVFIVGLNIPLSPFGG